MSHGTISAFYSSVDDVSELKFPGLHCTFGNIHLNRSETVDIVASVVWRKTRFCIPADLVFNLKHDADCKYNTKVLNNINIRKDSYFSSSEETYFDPYLRTELNDYYIEPDNLHTDDISRSYSDSKEIESYLSDLYRELEELRLNGIVSEERVVDEYVEFQDFAERQYKLCKQKQIDSVYLNLILKGYISNLINELKGNRHGDFQK